MNQVLQIVVCDYHATGEGITKAILVTHARATFEQRDKGYSPETIALLEFKETFGDFLSIGAEVISKDRLFAYYSNMIPEDIKQQIEKQYYAETAIAGNFKWSTEYHINYS